MMPLKLSDRVGPDLRLVIAQQIFRSKEDIRFEPPTILMNMVAAGRLGLESGGGLSAWTEDGKRR